MTLQDGCAKGSLPSYPTSPSQAPRLSALAMRTWLGLSLGRREARSLFCFHLQTGGSGGSSSSPYYSWRPMGPGLLVFSVRDEAPGVAEHHHDQASEGPDRITEPTLTSVGLFRQSGQGLGHPLCGRVCHAWPLALEVP